MSAYEMLERQLRDSIRALRPAARSSRRWFPRRTMLVLAPLALAGGVAGAATRLGGDGDEAVRLAGQARSKAAGAPSCARAYRDAPVRLVDGTPLPAISAALPGIATRSTPPPGAVMTLVRRQRGTAILRDTLHYLPLDDHRGAVVFVGVGGFPGDAVDPAGCLRARLDALAALRTDAADATRRRAGEILRQWPDTREGGQTLWTMIANHGPDGASGGGSAMRLFPGDPAPAGSLTFGGSSGYMVLTRPGTAIATVENLPPRSGVAVHRRIVPSMGLIAFTLPRHTGHMRIVQRSKSGKVLGILRFR